MSFDRALTWAAVITTPVQSFPDTPDCSESPDLTGHLWIQELATGGWLRFQCTTAGALTFATRTQRSESVRGLPVASRRGAELIRERIDRAALQAATDDPTAITFFGITTWNEGIPYDWETLPPFLGVDVWSGTDDRYLPPGAATSVFDRFGLPTLPAIETEQAIAHTDLTGYTDPDSDPEERPGSTWYDGPAAGVLVRDKTGGRCQAWPDTRIGAGSDPESATVTEVADEYVTESRISRTITRLRAAGVAEPPTVATVRDRIMSDIAREYYTELYRGDEPIVSMETVESVVAERVQRYFAAEEA